MNCYSLIHKLKKCCTSIGKTMENVRNRINFHLCSNTKQLRKKTSSPYFKSAHIFSENMVGVEMLKKDVSCKYLLKDNVS